MTKKKGVRTVVSMPGMWMFDLVPILVLIIFAVVLVIFIVGLVQGIGTWHKNNNSPQLTVEASVVSRRADVSHHTHHSGNGAHHHHTSTSYYVTFQVESGDRMEFHVPDQEYGYLVEGDRGRLTFQGTRYLGFARTR